MNRKIVLAALAAFLLAAPGVAFAQSAQDLWPAQSGNTWTYERSGRLASGTHEARVVATSGGWSQIEGFEGTHWWWMSSQSGRVYVWDAPTGTYRLAFDLGLGKGKSFKVDFPAAPCLNGSTWTIHDDAATIETKVGTFRGCVVIYATNSVCADAGIGEIVFAPKLGIVRTSEQSIAGPNTSDLVRAFVNGKRYEPAPVSGKGLTTRLTIDKHVYELWENRMPSVPPAPRPRRPDTMKVRFEIANHTAETVVFDYRSGQKYDFVIRDEKGREVYRWSADRFFTMALTRDTLAPGKSLVFEESIALVQADGTPIAPEKFTIEAIHTTSANGARAKAKAFFAIELRVAY